MLELDFFPVGSFLLFDKQKDINHLYLRATIVLQTSGFDISLDDYD